MCLGFARRCEEKKKEKTKIANVSILILVEYNILFEINVHIQILRIDPRL